MKKLFFTVLFVTCGIAANAATLELQQTPRQWEVIIRLVDMSIVDEVPKVSIYRGHLLETITLLRVKEEYTKNYFIGIYRNGKEMPHGTEIKVLYKNKKGEIISKNITMHYH